MSIKKVLVICVIIITAALVPVAAQTETLAVLDFTTEAVSKTEMTAIVEFLSAELFQTKKYTVIDVSQRETILNEMEFSMSGCSDDSCALEIGKLLSAELIVVGNLSKIGSRYLMSVKMLETETSKTMGTANGKFANLDELIDGLNGIAMTLAGEEASAQVAAAEQEPVAEPAADETEKTPEPAPVPAPGKPAPATQPAPQTAGTGGDAGLAIGLTAGGAVAVAAGAYFLVNLFTSSLDAYTTARSTYYDAFDVSQETYDSYYDASVAAYDAAMFDLIAGAASAGVGLVLTAVGLLSFPAPDSQGTAVSLLPVPGRNPGMLVRVSY